MRDEADVTFHQSLSHFTGFHSCGAAPKSANHKEIRSFLLEELSVRDLHQKW
jgi:hypothetical protein